MRRPKLDCEFVTAELRFALKCVEAGEIPDALDAIEIAADHIKAWRDYHEPFAVEGRER